MINLSIIILITSLILILISSIALFVILRKSNFKDKLWGALSRVLIITSISLINVVLVWFDYSLKNSPWIYSTLLLAFSYILIAIFIYKETFLNQESKIIGPSSLAIIAIITLSGIGLFINSKINISKNPNVEKVNLVLLEKSIFNVKDKFNEIEDLIEKESNNIDHIFSEISDELQSKNESLNQMQLREQELIRQIEYYKNLSSLSKEQTNAVVKALSQNNTLNYIISFILGILSSGIVWFLTRIKFTRKIFNHIENES